MRIRKKNRNRQRLLLLSVLPHLLSFFTFFPDHCWRLYSTRIEDYGVSFKGRYHFAVLKTIIYHLREILQNNRLDGHQILIKTS